MPAPTAAAPAALPARSGLASYGKRFGTYILDSLIGVVTVFIGWLIWFAIVAPRGQTPGMALVRVHCVDKTGRTASARQMWLRQVTYAGLLYSLPGWFTAGILPLVGYLWALWDKDRQTLHDKMAGTFVVDGPPPARG